MDKLCLPGDRVVVVTGAGSGIGLAIAERFVEAGDKVVLAFFGDDRAVRELSRKHPGGDGCVLLRDVDVSDIQQCDDLVSAAQAHFGRVDVLVTCAGTAIWGPSHSFSWDSYDRLLTTNLRGTFACIRAALPGMVERGAGRIITISSELSLVGTAEAAIYTATKGAINSLTRSLAREYAPHGVLVNCVAPGPTHTPMMENSPEFHDPKFKEAIPLHRFGLPSEIAGAVAMLAGPDGAFFVGQIISPNGGAAM